MPRLPTKRAEKVAYHEELGRLKARVKIMKQEPVQKKLEELFRELLKNPEKLAEAAVMAGLAYLGWERSGRSWAGALWGPVSLKMAEADNLVSGAAGVAGLAGLGILAALPQDSLNAIVQGLGDISGKAKEVDAILAETGKTITFDQCVQRVGALGQHYSAAVNMCQIAFNKNTAGTGAR